MRTFAFLQLRPRGVRLLTIASMLTVAGSTIASAQTGRTGFMKITGTQQGWIHGDCARVDHKYYIQLLSLTTSPATTSAGPVTITAIIGFDAAPLLISALDRKEVLHVAIDLDRPNIDLNAPPQSLTPYGSIDAVNAQITGYAVGTVPRFPRAVVLTIVSPATTFFDEAGKPSSGLIATLALPASEGGPEAALTVRGDKIQTLKLGAIETNANRGSSAPGIVLDTLRFSITHPVGAGQTVISPIHFSTHADTVASVMQQAQAVGDTLQQTTLKLYGVSTSGVPRVDLELQFYRGMLPTPAGAAPRALTPIARTLLIKPGASGSFDIHLPAIVPAGNHVLIITKPVGSQTVALY